MLDLATLLSSLSLLLSGAAPAAVQQQPAAQPVVALSIKGHGWGHGVGLSQWGAYGYAQHGSTYQEILAHYYSDTELGKFPGPNQIRVLLVGGAAKVEIASQAAFSVEDANGVSHDLASGPQALADGLKLKLDPDKPAKQLPGPLVFKAGAQPLSVNGKRYRGSLEVAVVSGRYRVVNVVGLDAYLLGVVPSEVPSNWPAEALKAQAVAARSYAVATRKPGGAFDAYADTRSQVYGGLDAEKPETSTAVQDTSTQVVLYGNKVATTYFFSTSGGRTANIEDAWPGSQPVPYLVSVPDPYDKASPYHSWGPTPITAEKLKSALALKGLPVDARVEAPKSGRVANLVLTLAGGSQVSVPGATVRAGLGLRSTWFTVGVLALRPPAATPVTFGAKAPFSGFVRGLTSVGLERRPVGAATWEKVGAVAADRNGEFMVKVKGQMTADYRLAAGKLAGPSVHLTVAPRLKLAPGAAPGAVAGTVRPAFPGANVAVQRLDGARWVKAASTRIASSGSFGSELVLAPGTYRARLAARSGYAAGMSEPLVVTP